MPNKPKSELDKYLAHHKPLCKVWEFSLRQDRHCTCGLEKARRELYELREKITGLEARLSEALEDEREL